MSRRVMGKASFIELQDSKGRIQVYITRDDICPERTKTYIQLYSKTCSTWVTSSVLKVSYSKRKWVKSASTRRKITVLGKSIKPLPTVKYKDGVAFRFV